MPNIIEQQDLLKGLTDDRLALLMKQPMGDIPPFLVAAEAQRRQSVRQQFSGSENKESVVDSLTRSMAKLPENIQAPAQTPPNIPQMMRMGGPVRRFAEGGGVGGYYPQGGRPSPMWEIPRVANPIPGVIDWVGTQGKNLYDAVTTPYSEMKPEPEEPTFDSPLLDVGLPDVGIVKGRTPFPDRPVVPRNENTGKRDTSVENQQKSVSQQKPVKDDFRARLEDLSAGDDMSSWEKAQKWFAMSEQFLDPSKTTGQSIAGAARAFAEGAGNEAAYRRESDRDYKETMLKYDMAKSEEAARIAEAQAAEIQKRREDAQRNKVDTIKYQADAAAKEADLYRRARDDAADALNKRIAALSASNLLEEDINKDPEVIAQQKAVRDANDMMRNAILQARRYRSMVDSMFGVNASFEVSDGDSISAPNG